MQQSNCIIAIHQRRSTAAAAAGYRQGEAIHKAALNEAAAAGLLLLAGWQQRCLAGAECARAAGRARFAPPSPPPARPRRAARSPAPTRRPPACRARRAADLPRSRVCVAKAEYLTHGPPPPLAQPCLPTPCAALALSWWKPP